MPDTLCNGRYRVKMEIADSLVSSRKGKYPIQQTQAANSWHYALYADKIKLEKIFGLSIEYLLQRENVIKIENGELHESAIELLGFNIGKKNRPPVFDERYFFIGRRALCLRPSSRAFERDYHSRGRCDECSRLAFRLQQPEPPKLSRHLRGGQSP